MKIKMFLILMALVLHPTALATTITVGSSGCDYVTIWEAIDVANPGDTIEVQSDTYNENVMIDIQLILRGVDTGGGLPVVDAGGRRDAITLYADGITIEGFIATNAGGDFSNDAGIKVTSNNNIVRNNYVTNNNANGISLVGSSGNTVSGNTANDNTYYGIKLEESSNNIIKSNIANNNEYPSGIHLYYSDNNVVVGNTVCANGRYGINAYFSRGNLIYQNNLIDNEDGDAHEYPYPNQWDNGTIGNRYGDFDVPREGCKDRNNDGICDFEYTISGSSSVDRYPLFSTQTPSTKFSEGTSITSFPGGIIGIDSTSSPNIKVNVFVDTPCAKSGGLKAEDFNVQEDGVDIVIDNMYFTGNASGQSMDIAVVFDDTGSMGEEISAMKSKVQGLTDQIKASGMDARYSLVTFKDRASVKTPWTSDPKVFKNSVDALNAVGGGDAPEASLDAIESIISMGFRSDAQKIILVITDATAHYKGDGSTISRYAKDVVRRDFQSSGVIFILVSPPFESSDGYVDLRDVANEMQSMWIDTNSADFSTILESLEEIITGTYVLEYTSPNLTPNTNGTVTVTVDKPGCDNAVGSVSATCVSSTNVG
jgi:parallel beta-helix repeat (two copies)